MKFFISILFLITFSLSGLAQSAQGRYHSRLTNDGALFFINPHKLKELHGLKHFDYDVTMLTWEDSATINFTFESTSMASPENVSIKDASKLINCEKSSVLYIDLKKNHYEIRVSAEFKISDLIQVFNSDEPPVFTFTQDGIEKTATYSNKAWRADKKKLNDIIHIFLYSKSL